MPQRPLSELQPLLRALLDDEKIVEFGWRQYTPYFNDGDPCVFGIYGFWVRTAADDDELDRDELRVAEYEDPHPSLGGHRREGDGWSRQLGPYEGEQQERYGRVRELGDALLADVFADVLLEAFGDHAQVTVRRTGIVVESYKHG
ncbi:hypothetical protein Cs7R123_70240 [Catellatospora sp. TT07R-123]|nr:hypothetical protein Cs7R123_70240 [Catellatospora sp. TT07R-123]